LARRNAADNSPIFHIVDHNRVGTDNSPVANCHPGHYYDIDPDPAIVANDDRTVKRISL
jgi:hypothetical protein